MNTSRPYLPTKRLAEIPVADRSLRRGGVVKLITPHQFKQQFGCEYTEGLWGPPEAAQEYQRLWRNPPAAGADNRTREDKEFEQKVMERLEHPRSDLVIVFVDDVIGNGVEALRDIPEGEILCIYAGDVRGQDQPDVYSYYLTDTAAVSAQNRRGMAGFMLDLPLDLRKQFDKCFEKLKKDYSIQENLREEYYKEYVSRTGTETSLEQFKLDAQTRKTIATCNVALIQKVYRGCPMTVIVSTGIEAGDPIGYPYGKDLWSFAGTLPHLLSKDIVVIPRVEYEPLLECEVQLDGKPPVINTLQALSVLAASPRPFEHKVDDRKTEAISSYYLRERLVSLRHNVNDERFAALSYQPSMTTALKQTFQERKLEDTSVTAYYQNPTERRAAEDTFFAVDIVVKASTQEKFSVLSQFFKPALDRGFALQSAATREIVLRNTNTETNARCFSACR